MTDKRSEKISKISKIFKKYNSKSDIVKAEGFISKIMYKFNILGMYLFSKMIIREDYLDRISENVLFHEGRHMYQQSKSLCYLTFGFKYLFVLPTFFTIRYKYEFDAYLCGLFVDLYRHHQKNNKISNKIVDKFHKHMYHVATGKLYFFSNILAVFNKDRFRMNCDEEVNKIIEWVKNNELVDDEYYIDIMEYMNTTSE